MDKDQEKFYRENLSPEMFEAWKHLMEHKRRMLFRPDYTLGDVLEVTGLTKAQLLNWLHRDLVKLSTTQNPGHGKRRLYTGLDIIMICAAQKLSSIGLPIKLVQSFSKHIGERAELMVSGNGGLRGYYLIFHPKEDGWRCDGAYGSGEGLNLSDVGKVFFAGEIFIVFQVDELIHRVLQELSEIKGLHFASGTAKDLRKAADEIREGEKE